MAGIHQTLKETRSLYAEAIKLQEEVLASHRDLKGCVSQVETLTVRLKYLGGLAGALVLMIGTLAGLAGGFLALMVFRLAGGAD